MTRAIALLALCAAVALVPSTYLWAGIASAATLVAYVAADSVVGLARSIARLRWIVLFTLVPQLVFLPIEAATANTVRVIAAISIAELVARAMPVSRLMDAVERVLRPVGRWVPAERIALMIALTVTTIPVLARLARTIREAQIARGVRPRPHRLVVPLLVGALKHADELGEALVARGFDAEPHAVARAPHSPGRGAASPDFSR